MVCPNAYSHGGPETACDTSGVGESIGWLYRVRNSMSAARSSSRSRKCRIQSNGSLSVRKKRSIHPLVCGDLGLDLGSLPGKSHKPWRDHAFCIEFFFS